MTSNVSASNSSAASACENSTVACDNSSAASANDFLKCSLVLLVRTVLLLLQINLSQEHVDFMLKLRHRCLSANTHMPPQRNEERSC